MTSRMGRLAIVWLSFFILNGEAPLATAEPFTVGYFDLPPHTAKAPGDNTPGAAMAYFEQIGKRMGLTDITFTQYPLPRLLLMLEDGQLDMALMLGKNPERDSRLVYPRQPYFVASPVLALNVSNSLNKVNGVDDLQALKIGVWQAGYLSPLLRGTQIQLQTLTGDQVVSKGLGMLVAGRFDGFYFPDTYSVRFEQQRGQLQTQVKILPMPEPGVALYSVFSPRAGKKYLAAYERALSEMQTVSRYEDFLQQY